MNNQRDTLKVLKKPENFVMISIAFVAFLIRLYGAINIHLTGLEAAYILGMKSQNFYTESLLQNILNQIIKPLAGDAELSYRLISVLAGTLFVYLPFLIKEKIGIKASLVCSLFFAIDPFLISNSIIFTGNTQVLTVTGLIVIVIINKNNKFPLYLLFLSIFLSGRGAGYLLVIFSALYLLLGKYRKEINKYLVKRISNDKKEIDYQRISILIFILIPMFIISYSSLDLIIQDIYYFIEGWRNQYQESNHPAAFLMALLSYAPLAVFVTPVAIIQRPAESKKRIYPVSWLGLVALILVIFYPGHQIIDLVWVSVPLWIICSLYLNEKDSIYFIKIKKTFYFYIILLVAFINLILGILTIVYQVKWGFAYINVLISIITIIVFMVALLIYWAYLDNLKSALHGFSLLVIFFLLIFQISNFARTAGFTGEPEKELFWNGYFPDKDIISKLVLTSVENTFGTQSEIDILVENGIDPNVYWYLETSSIHRPMKEESPVKDYFIMITEDVIIDPLDMVYLGQEFVSKSYPAWIWAPIGNLVQVDYWSWLLIRESQQFKEYNYLWLRSDPLD